MSELIAKQKGRLRNLILWLLWQSPRRGIDIIDDIYKMTWGWWKPSPGSVYPLLAKMEEEGIIEKLDDGRYSITQKGIEEIKYLLPSRYSGSVEDAVEELKGILMFFKEVDRNKLHPHKEKILELLKLIQGVVENA
ncbi:PadR family transcriptional regulator [Sulfurisphaera ohwakuensis]|uniref:PadR family transcriptional regulator n=1 Tax=Sulfurisphaera ohwakuensis TaxID=69656 RepID=UPI0036F3EF9D